MFDINGFYHWLLSEFGVIDFNITSTVSDGRPNQHHVSFKIKDKSKIPNNPVKIMEENASDFIKGSETFAIITRRTESIIDITVELPSHANHVND